MSRRMLLGGAAAAVPTILTLGSGAALANASNMMIGGSASTGNTGVEGAPGYYVCLETDGEIISGSYEFYEGNPGKAIPVDKQLKYKNPVTNDVTWVYGDEACQIGGDFKYGGTTYPIPRGMLLSATAYSSLATSLNIDFLNL